MWERLPCGTHTSKRRLDDLELVDVGEVVAHRLVGVRPEVGLEDTRSAIALRRGGACACAHIAVSGRGLAGAIGAVCAVGSAHFDGWVVREGVLDSELTGRRGNGNEGSESSRCR